MPPRTRKESPRLRELFGTTDDREVSKKLVKKLLQYNMQYEEITRVIDKEDGTKLHKTEVVVGQLIFLSKREDFVEGGSDAVSVTEDFDDFSDLDDKF